jgi:hypothetical protein
MNCAAILQDNIKRHPRRDLLTAQTTGDQELIPLPK